MRFISSLFFFVFLLLAPLQTLPQEHQSSNPKKIVVLGSSVAAGWVTSYQEKYDFQDGYAARLGRLLEPAGWQVVNISIPGYDTRASIRRFAEDVLPLDPDFVLIGLSMANEGLVTGNPDSVSRQYESGIRQLIRLCDDNSVIPVVGLCYSNDNYTAEQYGYLKRMNILINSLGIPCINLLGALNDGNGHFPAGCTFDPGHPDDLGHEELFYAFVPDLFDAIGAGKKAPDLSAGKEGSVTLGKTVEFGKISYIPSNVMHSFSFGFAFKDPGTGVVATLLLPNTVHEIILDEDGYLVYQTKEGSIMTGFHLPPDQWNEVMLTHSYLPMKTDLYINGIFSGRLEEQLEPVGFMLGSNPDKTTSRDLLIYRGALNPEEISALHSGKLIHASLEVYSPLNDTNLYPGSALANEALSLGAAYLDASDDQSRINRLTGIINQASETRAHELKAEYKQPIEVDPAIYTLYGGHYEIAPGDHFIVEVENNTLYLVDQGNRTELLPESEHIFFIRYPADLTVRFDVNDDAVVTGLVLNMNGREIKAAKVD